MMVRITSPVPKIARRIMSKPIEYIILDNQVFKENFAMQKRSEIVFQKNFQK